MYESGKLFVEFSFISEKGMAFVNRSFYLSVDCKLKQRMSRKENYRSECRNNYLNLEARYRHFITSLNEGVRK